MTYAQTMEYINHFGHTGAPVTDLSRMETLLEALGNPHRQLKFVHIAGTNGKGSTLTYCAEASMTAGIQTGMFTSPYILCYEDRIRVVGKGSKEQFDFGTWTKDLGKKIWGMPQQIFDAVSKAAGKKD